MKTCPHCDAVHPDQVAVCPTDGTALVELDPWPEGIVIQGKYRILDRIGYDAICAVYKSQQVKSNRLHTLRVMVPDLANDSSFVRLFQQDALKRKRLRHPNLAQVENIGEAEDGRPYIVMEYVAGQSLRKYIKQDAPFRPSRVCAIAKQVAAALNAAHSIGMVHRDVKPETIYVLDNAGTDKIKLLGLGVSKLQEALLGDRFRTAPDSVIGTFQYMSPEQALGQLGDELDGRADLYSLGVVMYQMLTGELPFHATSAAEWMMAHIQVVPIPIRVAHAHLSIPDVFTNLVTQCMSKNPEERPTSARQLIRDLELVEKEIERVEAESQAPVKARRPHGTSSGWKFWKS